MATAFEVVPDSWKDASIRTIKLAQTIINKSDRGLEEACATDPLPLIREACVSESNEKIHAYVRNTRSVVVKLRENFQSTNEEIKSLTRGKEALEKALEHKRKDLALNVHSMKIRSTRPPREKELDKADDLLKAERAHLLTLKKTLEAQLRKVQRQLQVLGGCRTRLGNAIQERSRVLELICVPQSLTSTGVTFNRQTPVSSNRKYHTRSQSTSSLPGSLSGSRPGSSRSRPDSRAGLSGVGPLLPLTPECVEAMSSARDAWSKSQDIRRELASAIDHTERLQRSAHESVNESLVNKLAATVTLKQHLEVNSGETKHAINRGQRLYDAQYKAQGYVLGPVSSSHLNTSERLDRPQVRVFQRHPGTDLPEAAHYVASQNYLEDSMAATRRNMGLLRLAGSRLQSDVNDKKLASSIDATIVRLRRKRSDHRWVLDGNSATMHQK